MRTRPTLPSIRRTTASVAITATAALVISMMPGGPAAAVAAAPADPGVVAVRTGLIRLGSAIAAAAEQPVLSEDLPLTELSTRDVLRLDSAIGTEVAEALSSTSTTLATLPRAFEDSPFITIDPVSPVAGAPEDALEWEMTIDLRDAVADAPLTYDDERLRFGSAELDGDLAAGLHTTIRFRYDESQPALRKFAIVDDPDLEAEEGFSGSELDLRTWTRPAGQVDPDELEDVRGTEVDIPAFTAVDGFVEVAAGGTATINASTQLRMRDPNGRGLITTEDLEFSSPSELFVTATPPAPDAVTMDLDLASDLAGAATGTLTVRDGVEPAEDDEPAAGDEDAEGDGAEATEKIWQQPVVERSEALDGLTALTRLQALSGFTQYVSGVNAVESSVDQEFPLLDLSVNQLYSPGNAMLDLLTEQATATITCGASDTNPPTGTPRPGEVRYCQAITSGIEVDPDEAITWESLDGATLDPEDGVVPGSAGRDPSARVAVSGDDGFPALAVSFTDTSGKTHRARTTVESIQDLGDAVSGLGLDGALEYTPATGALEMHVRQQLPDADTRTVATGGNGNLAPLTGLTGLCQAAEDSAPRTCPQTGDTAPPGTPAPQTGSATVTTSDRRFHADFGLGLTDVQPAPVAGAEAPEQPLVYLRPGTNGALYRVGSVDASLPSQAALLARIGFLQVDVDVKSYSLDLRSGQTTAAAAGVPTTTATLPREVEGGANEVTDVATVESLLAAPGTSGAVAPTTQLGLRAEADLEVRDSPRTADAASRPISATGGITASWPSLAPGTLPTVSTSGDYPRLRLLDIVPSRQAVMGERSGAGKLVDASADFYTQFGITAGTPDAERSVTRQLYDLGDDGATSTVCTQFAVTSATELTCEAGAAKESGVFAPGHQYLMSGDSDALRDALTQNLLAAYATFLHPDAAPDAERTFPLVDIRPTDISAARDTLGAAATAVQAAAEDPQGAPVSTMQDYTTTLGRLLTEDVELAPGAGADTVEDRSVDFRLEGTGDDTHLVLDTSVTTTGDRMRTPLRVATGDSEVRVIAGEKQDGTPETASVNLDVASSAKAVTAVRLADASSWIRGDAKVSEDITGLKDDADSVRASLARRVTEYGSSSVTSGAAEDIAIGIGVGADTESGAADDTWIALTDLPGSLQHTRRLSGDSQTCGNPSADRAGAVAACLELPLVGEDPAAGQRSLNGLGADEPTETPTETPTEAPTEAPTDQPTDEPTGEPSEGTSPSGDPEAAASPDAARETAPESATAESTEPSAPEASEAPSADPTESAEPAETTEPTETTQPTEAPTDEPTDEPGLLMSAQAVDLAPVLVALGPDETSGGQGGPMAAEPLAYRFLADGLSGLVPSIEAALDGDSTALTVTEGGEETTTALSLPFVGTDLDGATDVSKAVSRYVSSARAALTEVEESVVEVPGEDDEPPATTAPALRAQLQTALADVVVTGQPTVSGSDIDITLFCGGTTACDADDTAGDVTEASTRLTLTGSSAADAPIPFRIGPAGAAVETDMDAKATTTWVLDVVIGIERGKGPFIEDGPGDHLLDVTLDAGFADYDRVKNACHPWARHEAWKDANKTAVDPEVPAPKSGPCIDAFIGSMPAALVARTGQPNGLAAHVLVDAPASFGERAYLPTLYDAEQPLGVTTTGTGGISVYFETFASQVDFFDVVGVLEMSWTPAGYGEGLKFKYLDVDMGTLRDAVVPGFEKALKWLAPLNPVVDTLMRPIPVVSDMSKLIGKGPVSLLSLLKNSGTPIDLVLNLLQLQQLVVNPEPEKTDLRPIGEGFLGGFTVSPFKLGVGSKCTESVRDASGKVTEREKDGVGKSGRCAPGFLSKLKQGAKTRKTNPKDAQGTSIDKSTFQQGYISLPSVSVPVMQDTSQIMDLLQGTDGDATMLHVDLGKAGIEKQVTKSYGPFLVGGVVPVVATIGGGVDFHGRFAFGFDTRGLTDKVAALDTGDISGFDGLTEENVSLFSDGFFIDDLDDKGVDVPEIQLAFTVSAGAAVSIGFAEAGVRGGITLDLSLDANDPNGDGKIYTDEFAGSATGPDCAFNVSSGIQFFLQLYLSVDLIFYSYSYVYDKLRSRRFPIFEFRCDPPPKPKLATLSDDKLTLTLTTGANSRFRDGFAEVVNEKYTVRQIGKADAKGMVTMQVAAFNLTENHQVKQGAKVVVDGGSGTDTVRTYGVPQVGTEDGEAILPDPLDEDTVPTFDAPVMVDGGDGADVIETGDAADTINGGENDDQIKAGPGADTVNGDGGNDTIDGEDGDDVLLSGGTGDDVVTGGPGADVVYGGADDDQLDGGSGADRGMLFPTTRAAEIAPTLDSGDLVVGGTGSDTVTGGDGSDLVVGGTYDGDAAPARVASETDFTVFGLDETLTMRRVGIDGLSTVALPDPSVIDAECASPGASEGSDVDEVTGGGDDDSVIGGGGGDSLSGGAGDDTVCGRAGNDLLHGDAYEVPASQQGDDLVRGGPGDDRIYGLGGSDDLHGDADDDLVRGGDDDDTIAGGAGADLLLGEAGVDAVGGDGDGAVAVSGDADRQGQDITCSLTTSVVGGLVDLNGDLEGDEFDDGQLEGLPVADGLVRDPSDPAGTATFSGVLDGVVFAQGKADLDGNGAIQPRTRQAVGDTGTVPLAGLTGAAGNGDCILGGDGEDRSLDGGLGADYLDAGAGDDTVVTGGAGNDLVRGGDGDDLLRGGTGDDLVAGDADDDTLFGERDRDVLRGGSGEDLLAGGTDQAGVADGDDELLGDGGDDVVVGGNATFEAVTAATEDEVATDLADVTLLGTTGSDDDLAYGGYGDDWVLGQGGEDTLYGGPDDDVVEGGPGDDARIQGDDGDDLLVGGSSTTGRLTMDRTAAGTPDGDDVIVGDEGVDRQDGEDVILGDNGRLQPPSTSGVERDRWSDLSGDVEVVLFDAATSAAPAAGTSGNDTVRAGGENDLVLGQGGDDNIDAGLGDDGVEGGAGSDTIGGGEGDDRLLGGSWLAGSYDAGTASPGVVGGLGDTISGDEGDDLLLGDNGTPETDETPYVVLHDVPAPGAQPAAAYSGGDVVDGGDGEDRVFGQGGQDDLAGDDGIDYLEGNTGPDELDGGADDDVLVGGSSADDGVITPDRSANGMLDADDELTGGEGDDVLAGDNARVDVAGGARADGTRLRSVQLFDVATATSPAPTGTGAGDTIAGDEGRDLVFGQGGGDTLSGGDEDDYLEGNAGDDSLDGGEGEDDLVGGGSTTSGAIITVTDDGVADRLLTAPTSATDRSAAGMLDGNDSLVGGDERDILLGDNGRITRKGTGQVLTGGASGAHVVRQVAMADQLPGVWAGSDTLSGGAGDDSLYGQFDNTRTTRAKQEYRPGGNRVAVSGDVLDGGTGDDALVGDQGVDVPTPAKALGSESRTVTDRSGFLTEVVRVRGTLVRVVTLSQSTVGGDDLLLGGDGTDALHGGAGNDVSNAGGGDDAVFGGDGADQLWGGIGHDLVFGGAGNDLLDTKIRSRDTALARAAAPVEDSDGRRRTINGRDVLYGGSGADAMQADQGDEGTTRRQQGDRLIDWRSTINAYKVCASGYGSGKVRNTADSSMVATLRELARSHGAVGPTEVAIPGTERVVPYAGRSTFVCETR